MTHALDQALDSALADTPTPAVMPRRGRPGPRQELLEVRLSDLLPDPDNPREDVGDVEDLANSMAAAGLLQPVVARQNHAGRYVVVAGHRRLAAAQKLGWATISIVLKRDMRPDDVLAAMLIENGQRTDLDPIEEARAIARLRAQIGGATQAELARRIGRNQIHVSGRLALLALSIEDQELIRAGQMNLAAGIRRGRLNSGRLGKLNSTGHPHLGSDHDLSRLARARCNRLQHRSKGRNSVGGVACGECWESVIRADERATQIARSEDLGRCVLCDTPTDPGAPEVRA